MLTRLQYEFRVMGRRVLWIPIGLTIGFIIFSFLLIYLRVDLRRFISAGFEMFIPIVTGIVVATSATQDPALELQLTMPQKFHNTAMLRLLLIVGWFAIVGCLAAFIPALAKLAIVPDQLKGALSFVQFLGLQLSWIASTFWFVGAAFVVALLTRNRAASSAVLGAIWIVQVLFMSHLVVTTPWLQPVFLFPTTIAPEITYWFSNRLEVLATGLVLLPVGWLLLHNTEGLLKGSSDE